jgi:hypothetical protein
MIFERIKKDKKAQTVKLIIMLVVGLVVVGIMIYLGYKYILGTGRGVGELGSCQGQGGYCDDRGCPEKSNHEAFYGMGCPTDDDQGAYCCIPKERAG